MSESGVTRRTSLSAISHENDPRSNTYRPVDYDLLREMTIQKRLADHASLLKVKELQQVSKDPKDQTHLKQHKFISQRKLSPLATIRKRLPEDLRTASVDGFKNDTTSLKDGLKNDTTDLDDHAATLPKELETFQSETTGSVWNMRDNLRTMLTAHKSGGTESQSANDYNDFQQRLVDVRNQQNEILKDFEQEQPRLEGELNIDGLVESITLSEKHVQTRIPEEAYFLECSNLDRKKHAPEEFLLLNGRYVDKLSDLEREFAAVLNNARGGWTMSDHSAFVYISDLYRYHKVDNQRHLFLDKLRRKIPHKTKPEIVEHEHWCTLCKIYEHRKQDLFTDWIRDRAELLNRTSATFREAFELQLIQETISESGQNQINLCNDLDAKVEQWREKKMEVMRLEEEILERQRMEREEALADKKKMEQLKIQDQKDKTIFGARPGGIGHDVTRRSQNVSPAPTAERGRVRRGHRSWYNTYWKPLLVVILFGISIVLIVWGVYMRYEKKERIIYSW